MPDVKGLVVIEPAGTVAGQDLLERLTGLGQAFAYFTAGTSGPGLLALDSIKPGHSESLLLKTLLPEWLRKNILADLVFGNHYISMHGACNHVLWGLPEKTRRRFTPAPGFTFTRPA